MTANRGGEGRNRRSSPGVWLAGAAFVVTAAAAGAWTLAPRPLPLPALIVNEGIPPRGWVLWLDGRPTTLAGRQAAARDSAGRVLIADDRLRIHELPLPGELAAVTSAAPAGDGGAWIVDASGRVVHVSADGSTGDTIVTPYALPSIGSSPDVSRLPLVRSPEGTPFLIDTAPAVTAVVLDRDGGLLASVGSARVPDQTLLTDLANAGYVTLAGEFVIVAPFLRDEVTAYRTDGDVAWSLQRGLSQATPEPRFVVRDGRPLLDYFPVNLGIQPGPDGRIWVLSTADAALERSRLDVLDTGTGAIVATFVLDDVFPTIIVTPRGEAHLVPSEAVRARARDASRPRIPDFRFPGGNGSDVTAESLQQGVTVVNVWASWCAPCRDEMPELVQLSQELEPAGLSLLAVNDDVRRELGETWLVDSQLAPPVAYAAGAARRVFRYPGLPYTMLVDREGRIVRRWFGYGGALQIAEIREFARRELAGQATHEHEHH